ncbi:zinc finger BED domain-containing protein DAYSLEEPER-like [Melanaphis sacchari]|uniref:zinc finger BED domain-containing protein DAYSLEEPER-like n=1 Tax=Melanaphis sacchari TaxID=742174 RepID=UPI000DC15A7F|nr:zinc finger BED domain-containing protein DAYSLEEPER-like [Melanaphis sacchari]
MAPKVRRCPGRDPRSHPGLPPGRDNLAVIQRGECLRGNPEELFYPATHGKIQYPSHETKTGENIKKFMINAFTQLTEIAEGNNSSELMDNLTFVTDQGTNIISASSMKFMKSSGKNSQLSTVLVQEVKTRWNTRLLMLESIQRSLPEIIKIHGEFFCRLQNINRDLLQSLITFLKIFKSASDELEVKYANLEINNLDEDVEVNIDSIMKILGNKALTILDNKFQLSDVHEIAVFLWPKFKMLKMFSEENGERSLILGDIELGLLKFEIEDGEKRANSVTETNINSNSQELTSKEATMFSEWEDGVDERAQQSIYKYKKELESYREENYDISDDQILDFWSKQTLRFPYLSKLARQILPIPASIASSERSFSVAGRVIEQRRSL